MLRALLTIIIKLSIIVQKKREIEDLTTCIRCLFDPRWCSVVTHSGYIQSLTTKKGNSMWKLLYLRFVSKDVTTVESGFTQCERKLKPYFQYLHRYRIINNKVPCQKKVKLKASFLVNRNVVKTYSIYIIKWAKKGFFLASNFKGNCTTNAKFHSCVCHSKVYLMS